MLRTSAKARIIAALHNIHIQKAINFLINIQSNICFRHHRDSKANQKYSFLTIAAFQIEHFLRLSIFDFCKTWTYIYSNKQNSDEEIYLNLLENSVFYMHNECEYYA